MGRQSDSERRSQDGGSNGTTWGNDHQISEEMQIEALKEAYEEPAKCMKKRISFPQ